MAAACAMTSWINAFLDYGGRQNEGVAVRQSHAAVEVVKHVSQRKPAVDYLVEGGRPPPPPGRWAGTPARRIARAASTAHMPGRFPRCLSCADSEPTSRPNLPTSANSRRRLRTAAATPREALPCNGAAAPFYSFPARRRIICETARSIRRSLGSAGPSSSGRPRVGSGPVACGSLRASDGVASRAPRHRPRQR